MGTGRALALAATLIFLGTGANYVTLDHITLTSPAAAQDAVTFEREPLTLPTDDGPLTLDVEIADTPERRSRGLMERTDLGPEDGMLFDFGSARPITMWMRNTPTALDMVFLAPDGTVTHVAPDTVPFSTDIVSSRGPAAFVLEVVAGSAARWGLEPGDRLEGARFGE